MAALKVLMITRATLFSTPGGDTVQIQETAKALMQLGVGVEIKLCDQEIDYKAFDLIHFFNVIRPNSILPHIKKSKLPYVISTIFVDYSEVDKLFRGIVSRSMYKLFGSDGMEYIKTIGRWLINGEKILDNNYLIRGHKKSVELVLNNASALLPNSESELNRLKNRYRFNTKHTVIPNAVDENFFKDNGTHSDKKGVICVARIEPIKNQLNLIRALNNTPIQLKIIGQSSPNNGGYFDECKRISEANISFLGQLNKEDVLNEMRKAKVHVLPSWFETTGLSSLEAAMMGCNIVVTAKGDTREYFEKLAVYCEPDSPESIREAIESALQENYSDALKNKITKEYTWNRAAEKSLKTYREILSEESE